MQKLFITILASFLFLPSQSTAKERARLSTDLGRFLYYVKHQDWANLNYYCHIKKTGSEIPILSFIIVLNPPEHGWTEEVVDDFRKQVQALQFSIPEAYFKQMLGDPFSKYATARLKLKVGSPGFHESGEQIKVHLLRIMEIPYISRLADPCGAGGGPF
jgi:hypothetical protein